MYSRTGEIEKLIRELALEPHPEGGYYKRIYESQEVVETNRGRRPAMTSIRYLLVEGDFSAFHRIQSDEIWYWAGGPSELAIYVLDEKGTLGEERLTAANPTVVVPAKSWFAAELIGTGHSLVHCVVTPGFDFQDFELATALSLSTLCPKYSGLIKRLTR